jgi:hypothetical protein
MVVERGNATDDRKANGEWIRWALAIALAALVSYFTTVATVQQQTVEVKTTEASHFQEVLRRLDMLQVDVRELRHERDGR